MAKLNWSTTNTQVTDEIINVSSSVAISLAHDMFYSKVAKPIVISTGAGGTGTVLTETTDYTIGGTISTVPNNIATIAPDVIYSTVAITNATYHSTDLYLSYYPLGDLLEAEDFAQLINGIRLTAKDISGSNQTTLLTAYEPGGASALQDGGIVHVSWTGGDATYYHKFTSAYNAKNVYFDLPFGDAATTFTCIGYGDGGLTLQIDNVNSKWIILTDGCFDSIVGASTIYRQFVDKTALYRSKSTATATPSFTFTKPYEVAPLVSGALVSAGGFEAETTVITTVSTTIVSFASRRTGGAGAWAANPTSLVHVSALGEWRD